MLARLEVSLEIGAGARVIQEAVHVRNIHVILHRPLNNRIDGQCIASNTLDRAAQEILPAPLLGESTHFVRQLFGEITHTRNSVTYWDEKVYPDPSQDGFKQFKSFQSFKTFVDNPIRSVRISAK